MTTREIFEKAKNAVRYFNSADTETKNTLLLSIADSIENNAEEILSQNRIDIEKSKGIISETMTDRLRLTEDRIKGMAEGIREVAALPDPVGNIIEEREISNSLRLKKISVPMGVIGIIYESRPNVTSDAAALCIKSSNVCILRCGKEAHLSSIAVVKAMKEGLRKCGADENIINIIEDTSRDSANEMMKANGFIDLLIPRGGAGLIKACVENASVPCIETGTGICTVYVDESADQSMALDIIENAKCSRPSVCNAEEVLLINEKIAKSFLPKLQRRLTEEQKSKGKCEVELRLCPKCLEIINGKAAGECDFDTEFLDYILAVKIVKDVKEAAEHISLHTTHHSEAIITENQENADYFCSNIDSACIYVNASTRFTDGGVFGLGCEMGISTQKMHARGPMGLRELTSYKYIINGCGQIR